MGTNPMKPDGHRTEVRVLLSLLRRRKRDKVYYINSRVGTRPSFSKWLTIQTSTLGR